MELMILPMIVPSIEDNGMHCPKHHPLREREITDGKAGLGLWFMKD
jgi:hypothetical protein